MSETSNNFITKYFGSVSDIKKGLLVLMVISLLGGIYCFVSGFFLDKIPTQNDLTVVNGVFDSNNYSGGKYASDDLSLKDGSDYNVPYFLSHDEQRETFESNVVTGQNITLWVYKDATGPDVMFIESNNKIYLSFDNSLNDYKNSMQQAKIATIILIFISFLLFCLFLFVGKYIKKTGLDTETKKPKNMAIEIKYAFLAFLAIPIGAVCLLPFGWICNHVPNGILGLFIVIAYIICLAVLLIGYLIFLKSRYSVEVEKTEDSSIDKF